MSFDVIPAVDVSGGRLARLSRGRVVPVEAFGGDPVAAARAFADAGAARVHVVDLDRVLGGSPGDPDPVRLVAGLRIAVQASGGIETLETARSALAAGAERIVVGSGALADRDLVAAMLDEVGERAVLGIEIDGERIRPRSGGRELGLGAVLDAVAELRPPRLLVTAVGRVSALGGPDVRGALRVSAHTGVRVLVAGGIRNVGDLTDLAALGGLVEGAVVGRALYEGLDLREALAAVRRTGVGAEPGRGGDDR